MTPEEMAALHARAFAGQGRGWRAEEFAALLSSPHVFAIALTHLLALGRVAAGEAELLTLAIETGHRRRGLGRKALEQFEIEAISRGATRAFLEVGAENEAALALYIAAGYRQSGRRAGYYTAPDGCKVDALLLEKTLS